MNKYIFFTPEGLTCKPNIDRPEPEFVDLQIIGFGHDTMVQDALKDLIEVHSLQPENKIGANFAFQLESDKNSYLRSWENTNILSQAS